MNEAKRQLVRSWLTKAQHDLASARVLAANAEPLLDTAIYHCQQASEPFNHGSNISVIGSMSLSGVGPTMTIKGPVDTQIFDAYVEHFLVPTLLPGDKVLLDNVKFHYSERALYLIYAAGASVIHIPAYSPDYNPIEECISKIKEALRQAKARTVRKLFNALARAIEKVTIDDICGWFAHCGYTFLLN